MIKLKNGDLIGGITDQRVACIGLMESLVCVINPLKQPLGKPTDQAGWKNSVIRITILWLFESQRRAGHKIYHDDPLNQSKLNGFIKAKSNAITELAPGDVSVY